jgi:hypothetical protein
MRKSPETQRTTRASISGSPPGWRRVTGSLTPRSTRGGDTTLDSQASATFGIESASAARVCATHRTSPAENDIEFGD